MSADRIGEDFVPLTIDGPSNVQDHLSPNCFLRQYATQFDPQKGSRYPGPFASTTNSKRAFDNLSRAQAPHRINSRRRAKALLKPTLHPGDEDCFNHPYKTNTNMSTFNSDTFSPSSLLVLQRARKKTSIRKGKQEESITLVTNQQHLTSPYNSPSNSQHDGCKAYKNPEGAGEFNGGRRGSGE